MKNQGPQLGVVVAGSVKTSGQPPPPRAIGEGHCYWIMSEDAAEDRLTLAMGPREGKNGCWCDSMQIELSICLPSQPFCFLHLGSQPHTLSPSTPNSKPTLYSRPDSTGFNLPVGLPDNPSINPLIHPTD